jgi:hypothetical protein
MKSKTRKHAELTDITILGTSTAPTPDPSTNTDQLATAAFVKAAITALINGSPGALDTLNELAAALGNDANFATTVTNTLALKLNISAYTAADVLAKLLTVDGAGSGLVSDTSIKLATARAIALSGDVTGSGSFDGSTDISIVVTVADDSHNHVIANIDGLQTALDTFQVADPTLAKFKASNSIYTNNTTSQVFTDAFCTANSLVTVVITSVTKPQGLWSVDSAAGSFTITSTVAESTDITFNYYIHKVV